jgi:hypothetical protein
MPSFKRRTKAEKRNRLRKKMIRQIKNKGGFPANRNSLRWLIRFLNKPYTREGIGANWSDAIINMIRAMRDAALQINLFAQSLNQLNEIEREHRAKYPESY